MDLIIGLIAIVLVAYYIVKGYSATGVLMFGGLVLLFISVLMGHSILPEGVKSTGSTYFDILEYVKYLLSNRGGGLGLMIMVLCGFSVYMTHLGANDVVVKLVSKPLKTSVHPYYFNGICLFPCMFNVFCRVICNRFRRVINGDIIPCHGQRGDFTWGCGSHLCIANFYYPFPNIGRRGAFC